MGIQGLLKFVKEIPEGITKIDIEQEIEEAKFDLIEEPPLVIVDMAALITIDAFVAEILCGGRGQMQVKRIRRFLERMIGAGAKLVFFTDSGVFHVPEHHRAQKRNKQTREMDKFMRELKGRKPLSKYAKQNSYSGHYHVQGNLLVKEVVAGFGPLFESVTNNRDILMARYAEEHKTLAVITRSCDKLVFASVPRVWLAQSISWENIFKSEPMTVNQANALALRTHLELAPGDEMGLWATLVGNQFLEKHDVTQFIKTETRFMDTAEYIRKDLTGKDLDQIYSAIARHFACSIKKIEKRDSIAKGIEESLKFYRCAPKSSKEEDAYHKFLECEVFLPYAIMANKPIEIVALMENFQAKSKERYSNIAFEALKRAFGVFLKHLNDPKLKRQVFTVRDQKIGYMEYFIYPEYPTFDVEDIESLVFGSHDDTQLTDLRLQALNHIFQMQWTHEDLLKVENHWVSLRLTLDVMEKRGSLEKKVTDLIWSCFEDQKNNQVPDELEVPEKPSRLGIGIAFMFLNLYNLMNIMLGAVGFAQYVKVVPFDAVHFQIMFNEAGH